MTPDQWAGPKRWRAERLRRSPVNHLYHLTHIENLESILHRDILPKNKIDEKDLPAKDISDPDVQKRRADRAIPTPSKKVLFVHDFVPLFFVPKTPMLFVRKDQQDNLCLLNIDSEMLLVDESYPWGLFQSIFCDGNIASSRTKSFWAWKHDGSPFSNMPWSVLHAEDWTIHDDGKRKRAAEVLVYPSIPERFIQGITVRTHFAAERVNKILERFGSPIKCIVYPEHFF